MIYLYHTKMNKPVLTYIIGFLLLVTFLWGDMLPVAVQVNWLTDHEVVTHPETESSGKSAESTSGFERGEYWIDYSTGHLLPVVPSLSTRKLIPGNIGFIQKVYLSIPTPPPDIV